MYGQARELKGTNLNDTALTTVIGRVLSLQKIDLEAIRDCRTLETLLLWGCEEITDRGIRAIAGLPHLTRLELPELSAVSDAAILELASESSRLKILRLTSLKAVSAVGIAALGKISGLEHLTIQACPNVTDASVKSLRIALPSCHIDYAER